MITYTPEMVSSGQYGICGKCGKAATKAGDEVYDGCLGALPDTDIMNACCGHGQDAQAYIQYWSGRHITGQEAIFEQKRQRGCTNEV